ncbi:hypothetical protein [uncultured Shewanella sp.]|uniref:hypothetical protein n=1 Tax=uncultured Shewanella sp. TaxID=173975 RepID=UPI002625E037|nr:hypothetical protein [uncultured Shewanella sp.]
MKTSMSRTEEGLSLTIEVNNIEALDNLHFIADELVNFSYSIDRHTHKEMTRYGQLYCAINITTPQQNISEEALFHCFSKDNNLTAKAVVFIENIIRWSKDNETVIWQDEENHLAQDGATVLCKTNPKFIPLYTDLLLQSDLDHEVHQGYQIEQIINLYGLTNDTVKILAYRQTSANGQYGHDEVEGYKEQLLNTFKEKPELKTLFLETCASEIVNTIGITNQQTDYSDEIEELTNLTQFIENKKEAEEWLSDKKSEFSLYP